MCDDTALVVAERSPGPIYKLEVVGKREWQVIRGILVLWSPEWEERWQLGWLISLGRVRLVIGRHGVTALFGFCMPCANPLLDDGVVRGLGRGSHCGAHGIEIHVAHGGEQCRLIKQRLALEPTLPKAPGDTSSALAHRAMGSLRQRMNQDRSDNRSR